MARPDEVGESTLASFTDAFEMSVCLHLLSF